MLRDPQLHITTDPWYSAPKHVHHTRRDTHWPTLRVTRQRGTLITPNMYTYQGHGLPIILITHSARYASDPALHDENVTPTATHRIKHDTPYNQREAFRSLSCTR
jgi:hypothetical protein